MTEHSLGVDKQLLDNLQQQLAMLKNTDVVSLQQQISGLLKLTMSLEARVAALEKKTEGITTKEKPDHG
jgi:hypothetical protein